MVRLSKSPLKEKQKSTAYFDRHPNIVTFMGMSIKKNDVLLITEFVDGKTLQEYIEDEEHVNEAVKSAIVRDILKGVGILARVECCSQ